MYNVRRAQESGAGQSSRLKLMARSLAPRCVTTSGQQDALAIVSISRSCTTVKATAPSRVSIYCFPLRVIRRIGQGVFTSGKMLLERIGLNQCQVNCVQPFRRKSRVHLEGASATDQPVAKYPNICSHRWNPNPKREEK